MRRRLACGLWVAGACTGPGALPGVLPSVLDDAEQAATVCGRGPTVKGIDVSYYQGAIDWPAVRADGVEYAFVRATDGLGYRDSRFAANWAGAKASGLLRGVYQFFRPAQDPVAQAELLLDILGADRGELPPVIDVEDAGGLAPAAVEAAVRAWLGRVRPVIGREPIIYTGYYFWRDQVGGADLSASPLWHAQYTAAACPTIPAPWTSWAFWQFTSTGRVAGIAGDVDVNRFDGTLEDLDAFAANVARPCGTIGAAGGEIDDGDACFQAGGPPQFLRAVSAADGAAGGDLVWTYTTKLAAATSFARWTLHLAEAGRYRVEVSTPAPYAGSRRARYLVTAAGADHTFYLDQAAASGWQPLAELDFAAGGSQSIYLADNTGEPTDTQLAFDGIRLVRVSDPTGTDPDPAMPDPPPDGDAGGCSASRGPGGGGSGGPALALVLALGALCASARRRAGGDHRARRR